MGLDPNNLTLIMLIVSVSLFLKWERCYFMSSETYMPMRNCARDLLGEMIMKDKGEGVE